MALSQLLKLSIFCGFNFHPSGVNFLLQALCLQEFSLPFSLFFDPWEVGDGDFRVDWRQDFFKTLGEWGTHINRKYKNEKLIANCSSQSTTKNSLTHCT